jgi:hypothetical protein
MEFDSTSSTPLALAARAIAMRNVTLRIFLLRLLDPEDLGHAVTAEVRHEALRLLVPNRSSKTDGDVTIRNATSTLAGNP